MSVRVTLRSPFGGVTTRDIAGGIWVEPSGTVAEHLGLDLWALPGLADAHAHLAGEQLNLVPGDFEKAAARARAALEAGVQLVLDKGWCDATAIEVMESLPPTDRPDIEAAARMIAVAGGYYPGFAHEIEPGDVIEAVEKEADEGAGWVKLIGDWPRRGRGPLPNFDEAQLRSAVETAESAGAKVALHTMAPDVPTMAVAAGVHSIEHGLFLNRDDLESLGSRGGMWVPTVMRVEELVMQLGENSSGGKLLLEGLANSRRLLPLASEAGVRVLTGTDLAGSTADVASEALKLAEYGLGPEQALRAVAHSPFATTGMSVDYEIGSPANAVLFSENPLEQLGALRRPAMVIRLGRVR